MGRLRLLGEIFGYVRRPFITGGDEGSITISLGAGVLNAFRDHVGLKLAGDPQYEQVISTWITGYSRFVGLFVDVGANIGYHALTQANNFKDVVAIEPNPKVYELLIRNVRRSSCKNIQVLNVGLSSRSDRLPFVEVAGSTGSAHFVEHHNESCFQLTVKAFDELVSEYPNLLQPAVIKIDVEGWELHVFEGMRSYIDTMRPIIIFEWDGRTRQASDFEQVRKIVGDHYEFFTLDKPRPRWANSKVGYVLYRVIFGYPNARRLTIIENKYYLGIAAIPRDVPRPIDMGLAVG